jgi:hypothetical protein
MKKFSLACIFCLLLLQPLFAQKEIKGLRSLRWSQKVWVMKYPFVAFSGYRLTKRVLAVTAAVKADSILDGDANGGQVDAFRHSFWMASMAQRFAYKKVIALGLAHEKDDYRNYKRDLIEDGSPGDSLASLMDKYNNKTGADIGHANRKCSEAELKALIISAIKDGKMTVLWKDEAGNYLTCEGLVLRIDDYKGRWYKPKCFKPSNCTRRPSER